MEQEEKITSKSFTKVIRNNVNPVYQAVNFDTRAGKECFDLAIQLAEQMVAEKFDELKFDDLFKAIEKIEEGSYGSAKNFIHRYINTFGNHNTEQKSWNTLI